MRGLTQLGGAYPQQVGGMQMPQQVAGMQVGTLPTTVPAQEGLDIGSIMNMMIMMMIVVMMMKMMTGAMASV